MQKIAPDSILLIRLSSLGDIILTTPLIRALSKHYPEASIDYVTKTEFAEILVDYPNIRHVYAFDSRSGFSGLRKLAKEIRSAHYDLAVDLHVNPRSIYLRTFGGARMVRRYRKRSLQRQLLRKFHINLLKDAGTVIERYFTALEDFGIAHDGLGPRLYPDAGSKQKAGELLMECGSGDRLLLGLAPGASRATKRWPASRFAEAAVSLAGTSRACFVLIGAGEDSPAARRVKEALSGEGNQEVIDLVGKLKLLEAAAVIEKLDLLLSNDTALMHMATAVNTPVVAVFGPTSRELGFFPFGGKARVIEKPDLDCRPCTLHGDAECPEGHFRCMNEIPADRVVEAGLELLAMKKEPA